MRGPRLALGGVLLVAGGVLLWGNLSGRLRTAPFAGEVTIAIGGMMMSLARDRRTDAAENKRDEPPG